MSRSQPTVINLLRRDALSATYTKLFAWLWGFVCLMLLLAMVLAPPQAVVASRAAGNLSWVSGIVALACIPIIGWRVALIRRVIRTGRRTIGQIIQADNKGTNKVLRFSYPALGHTLVSTQTIVRSRAAWRWRAGQSVQVVFDPKRPEIAFITDVYSHL